MNKRQVPKVPYLVSLSFTIYCMGDASSITNPQASGCFLAENQPYGPVFLVLFPSFVIDLMPSVLVDFPHPSDMTYYRVKSDHFPKYAEENQKTHVKRPPR